MVLFRSYTNVSKSSKCPKLAFDIERNSIFESESPIYVLNENSELSSISTTSSNAATRSSLPTVQIMQKSFSEWEDSCFNHSMARSTLSPAPLQSESRLTPSPAPLQSGSRSTLSPAPLQSGSRSAPSLAPLQSGSRSTLSPAPLQSGSRSAPSPAPLQSGSRSTPSPAPLQTVSRSTPSPALLQNGSRSTPTPPSQECTPKKKKTKDLSNQGLEESFFNLTQIMQQRYMAPNNSGPASTADNSFASLIVAELGALPDSEKRSRKQRILQILYEPYNACL
ncbi:flocculation protein FLO11-like [Mycetomoellerius zeteki]|uniref:flocculation protein FLO11-like n=1 Tax=Mycetomoellerius zeteki TaxID=64791 RepID=UPI00084EBC35|nr:PREDICTED: flocculation protein FLO11-like [Trachymyrmex zeteki]